MAALRQAREKLTRCKYCQKECYSPSKLERHLLNYTVVKSFQCDMCGISFSQKSTLAVTMLWS